MEVINKEKTNLKGKDDEDAPKILKIGWQIKARAGLLIALRSPDLWQQKLDSFLLSPSNLTSIYIVVIFDQKRLYPALFSADI